MSEIKITTSGEIQLNGDVVGRIEWLKPFVESDVAGTFDQDDPFVDEWGARIDCTACLEKDDLLDDLDGSVARARRLLGDARKKLKALNLQDGATAQRLVEVDVLLGALEFTT
jgi:hypothetical protein